MVPVQFRSTRGDARRSICKLERCVGADCGSQNCHFYSASGVASVGAVFALEPFFTDHSGKHRAAYSSGAAEGLLAYRVVAVGKIVEDAEFGDLIFWSTAGAGRRPQHASEVEGEMALVILGAYA